MIDRKSALVLGACLALSGAGYWWVEGGTLEFPAFGSHDREKAPSRVAEAGGSQAVSASFQKAILACLLAASYGAERGARIDQVEQLTNSLSAQDLSAQERRELEALKAAVPEHRKERDASYALYFSGIEALAAASPEQTADAFAQVSGELDKAGLKRLTRYVPTIRKHIENLRGSTRSPSQDQRWIQELKNAVTS